MPNTKPFAFFGTPYVARDTLAALIAHGYVPSVVITSPDAPKGRGLALQASKTNELARAHNIPVHTPAKLTPEAIEEIASYGCAYGIVVAYGKLLPQTLIDIFPLGLLNIHYSLLPKYRGASPVEAALLNGDEVTGVSIQKLVLKLDAGDVYATEELTIEPTETTRHLRARLITLGSDLLLRILPAFEQGSLVPTSQDESEATHVGKIKKEEGELRLGTNDPENWRKYRAFYESPGTYFFVEKHGARIRVKVTAARYENDTFIPERVIPEGKREMAYADFVRNL